MIPIPFQLPTAGRFRYQNGDVVYEQRWHVNAKGLKLDEPFVVDMPTIEEPPPPPVLRLDCLHRGAEIERRECPSCGGRIKLTIFACDIHKQTTIARQVDDLACCAICSDYEREP